MKLVYAVDRISYNDRNHIGVRKKVQAILRLLEKNGVKTYLHEYTWQGGFPTMEVTEDTDVLYFRRVEPSIKLCIKLMELKKRNRGLRIIMEIPTYPFEGERIEQKKIKERINNWIGKKILKYVMDRIVLIGQREEVSFVYNIPVIHAKNGVDYNEISVRENHCNENEINLIAVSGCYFWHGYDRLIKGLKKYYEMGEIKEIVNFHIVGEGDCLEEYKQLASEYGLFNSHVFLYGSLIGKELDEIYNKCNVAIDCLGCHRKQLYYVSSLKVREYAAKGLPIVTATQIDIYNENVADYILEVPTDETDIDIVAIIHFANKIYQSGNWEEIAMNIRKKFQPYCEWDIAFKNVLQYILN